MPNTPITRIKKNDDYKKEQSDHNKDKLARSGERDLLAASGRDKGADTPDEYDRNETILSISENEQSVRREPFGFEALQNGTELDRDSVTRRSESEIDITSLREELKKINHQLLKKKKNR